MNALGASEASTTNQLPVSLLLITSPESNRRPLLGVTAAWTAPLIGRLVAWLYTTVPKRNGAWAIVRVASVTTLASRSYTAYLEILFLVAAPSSLHSPPPLPVIKVEYTVPRNVGYHSYFIISIASTIRCSVLPKYWYRVSVLVHIPNTNIFIIYQSTPGLRHTLMYSVWNATTLPFQPENAGMSSRRPSR